MKMRRNDPCPCGSGKKYKKCCYNKEENKAAEENPELQDSKGDLEELLELEKLLVEMAGNMRVYKLKRIPHIKEYQKIRKMHSEIGSSMIQYYYDGKFEQEVVVADGIDTSSLSEQNGSAHLLESEFDLNTETGEKAFHDTLIYKNAANINCITERFIQTHRYRKLEKVEFLHSMLNSKLGLFEITGADPDQGYILLKEVFTGIEHKIIDIGLSGNPNNDEIYIYTRVITYHDISFSTGLSFVFSKKDRFIQNHIQHHKKDYSPNGEFLRFIQLYNYYSTNPDQIRTVRI